MEARRFRFYLLVILLIIAIVRYYLWLPQNEPRQVIYYNGQKLDFKALVVDDPKYNIDSGKLVVQPENLKGKVLVTTELYPRYYYGDLLQISCRLVAPKAKEGFAYDKYLAKSDIYSICYQPKINIVARGQGSSIKQAIFAFKQKAIRVIDRQLPSPTSALLTAIIFGDTGKIPAALADNFSRTGTTHIMAVSGMNITLLVAIMLNFLVAVGLRRKTAYYFIVVFLSTFVFLIGAPASAVRALIMGILWLTAAQIGRINNSGWALTLAGAVMLALNPMLLFYDAGFQLSFLSMWGLGKFGDLVNRFLEKAKIPSAFAIRESLASTIAAQIGTLPLMVYSFHSISIISLLVNVLVLPVIPVVMITGLILVTLGLAIKVSLIFLSWFVYLFLYYMVGIINFFGKVDFAALNINIGLWSVVVYYLLLLVALYWKKVILCYQRLKK
ncbi:MAG: ComEC/Rec2 family competence protein [Patescibacteria group bacterium]|jgi:competence protein ComEC